MKNKAWSLLTVAVVTLALVASACGGSKATTSATKPPTTTTASPTTTTTTTTPPKTTTTTPPATTTSTGGGTLPSTGIAITTHSAAVMASYNGLCAMCHGAGTSNAAPFAGTWDGKKNGSTVNTGVYTIAAGSPQDHTGRTPDQCTTQAGCHGATGGTTTPPPSSTTTTPPVSSTTPPVSSTTPTSTIASGVAYIDVTVSGFQPVQKLTAKVNIKITFTNKLEGDDFVIIKNGTVEVTRFALLKGQNVDYTFTKIGDFVVSLAGEDAELDLTIIA